MAPTSLRSETAGLVRLADRDLSRLWRLVADGANAEVALRDLLPSIVREYGQMGAATAAIWYDEQRAKAGVKGRFRAFPMKPSDRGADSLVGWALSKAQDDASLKTLIAGGTQRRIADHVRGTIMGSSVADPGAHGWQRVTAGGCSFCVMLESRGSVYSEASADFASHDHCNCSAVPAFEGEAKPVKGYTPTTRNVSDADRARLRKYLRENF
jgi:hypothetical protein